MGERKSKGQKWNESHQDWKTKNSEDLPVVEIKLLHFVAVAPADTENEWKKTDDSGTTAQQDIDPTTVI